MRPTEEETSTSWWTGHSSSGVLVSADSQTQVGVGLLQDLLRVEMIGRQVLSPAHDGVDLLGQFLGLLLQLLMLLHTPPTVSRRSS